MEGRKGTELVPVEYDPFSDPKLSELIGFLNRNHETLLRRIDEHHDAEEEQAARRHDEALTLLRQIAEAVTKPRRITLTRNPDGSPAQAISEIF